jgi:hypothetical protein
MLWTVGARWCWGRSDFARDQHILNEWWRREIDEDGLRERIRFDLDWGYDWQPCMICW